MYFFGQINKDYYHQLHQVADDHHVSPTRLVGQIVQAFLSGQLFLKAKETK